MVRKKVIKLNGFLTNSSLNSKKAAAAIETLNEADFISLLNTKALSYSVDIDAVYNQLISSPKITFLNLEALALILKTDVSINALDGKLEIKISNHGPDKLILIDGFLTHEGANAKTAIAAVQSLNSDDLASLKDNHILSSNLSIDSVFSAIHTTDKISKLDPEVRGLILKTDIKINFLDGKLEITIANHGPDKIIIINGFLTQADYNAKAVFDAIQKITANDFVSSVDPKILSTSVTLENVYKTLMNIPVISGLTPNQKALILQKNISLNALDGSLQITINNNGSDKSINLTGFNTQSNIDAQTVAEAVSKLSDQDFAFLASSSILSTSISINNVLEKLLNANSIKSLTDNQKSILSSNDVALVYGDTSLEILIKIMGQQKF